MSDSSLDFDRADFASQNADAAPTCGSCSGSLSGTYYTLGEQMLCEPCHFEARDAGPSGSMFSRALGALGLGCLAGVLAGGLWMVVTELTGYEIGLIAVVVGLMVGIGVRLGARGVGGFGYQLLAVFITYSAIVMTHVPTIVTELRANTEIMTELETAAADASRAEVSDAGEVTPVRDDGAITATLYLFSIPLAYMAPFLMGLENVIGLLIIGFALYEAWKLNRHVELEMSGPFQLGADAAPVG